MKLHLIITILFLLTKQSYSFNHRFIMARYDQSDEPIYNASEFSNVSISSVCNSTDKICIWKCCPFERSGVTKCKSTKSSSSIFNITVYDANFKRTGKSFDSIFKVVPGIMSDPLFQENAMPIFDYFAKPYLIEDGTLYLEMANTYHRRLPVAINRYCVSMRKTWRGLKPLYSVEILPEIRMLYNSKKIFKEAYALGATTIFLLLTIMPYRLFPQLKDTDGSILIVYIAITITAMLIKTLLIHSVLYLRFERPIVAGIDYFFLVSQLCWTNVMFYRLRGTHSNKTKGAHSSNKMMWIKYCAYAIGLPLSLMIFVFALEITDMSHMPWFITPQLRANSYFNGMESLLYLYVPSALLLAYDWIVCIINVVEFWRQPKSFSGIKIKSSGVKSPLRRKAQYVKLLVLLSICCIVNVLSIIYPESNIRGDTTFYFTLCFGPVVFITFVVDKDVLIMAKEYFATLKKKHMTAWFKKCDDVAVEAK